MAILCGVQRHSMVVLQLCKDMQLHNVHSVFFVLVAHFAPSFPPFLLVMIIKWSGTYFH